MSKLYITAGGDGRAKDVGMRAHNEAFAAVRSYAGSVTVRMEIINDTEVVSMHVGRGSIVGGRKLLEVNLSTLLNSSGLKLK